MMIEDTISYRLAKIDRVYNDLLKYKEARINEKYIVRYVNDKTMVFDNQGDFEEIIVDSEDFINVINSYITKGLENE